MLLSVWWPEMHTDIHRFTDACDCKHVSAQGRERPKRQHPLGEMDTRPSGLNACLCVDYCSPFPERNGFTWVMVVSCRGTKFVCAFATKTQTGAETAYILLHGWVLNYGLPNTFLSDQGPLIMLSLSTLLNYWGFRRFSPLHTTKRATAKLKEWCSFW